MTSDVPVVWAEMKLAIYFLIINWLGLNMLNSYHTAGNRY